MKYCMAILTGICILACGVPAAAGSRHVEKVTVRAGSRNVTIKTYQMKPGQSISLKTSVSPGNAAGSISCRSSKKDAAAVSRKGKAAAKKAGTARGPVEEVLHRAFVSDN